MSSILGGQFNLHRGLAGATSLGCMLNQRFKGTTSGHSSFIIGLQEPAVAQGNRVIGFDASYHLLYDKSATRVRAALCVSPLLDVWQVALYSDGDTATGLWKNR